MGIVEYEKEIWEVQPVKSLAQTLYDKQVKDITNISHTEWFKQIKDYWKRVWDGAKEELKTISPENLETTFSVGCFVVTNTLAVTKSGYLIIKDKVRIIHTNIKISVIPQRTIHAGGLVKISCTSSDLKFKLSCFNFLGIFVSA